MALPFRGKPLLSDASVASETFPAKRFHTARQLKTNRAILIQQARSLPAIKRKFVRSTKTVKSNLFARMALVAFAALVVFVAAPHAVAQEEEGVAVVLDEPIVQVNNNVIMLSTLKRQLKDFKEALIQRQGLTEAQAEAEIAKRQPEIIFGLITEELLLQAGKEIPGLAEQVEAEVNREMLRVCRSQNLNTLERCEEAMRAEGISAEEIRQTLRAQFMKQAVLQRQVDTKIYFGFTDAELRKYYESNRDKFQSVTLSEIFLSAAGRKPEEVGAKAAQIVAEARKGVDFGSLAETHSEREGTKKVKGRIEQDGKLRWLLISEIGETSPKMAAAIKPLKAGEVSDPVQVEEGFIIFKVHERDDAFNENQVRSEMLRARGDKDREEYVKNLRKDAYIKPAPNYKEMLQPLLDKDMSTTADKDAADKKAPKQ